MQLRHVVPGATGFLYGPQGTSGWDKAVAVGTILLAVVGVVGIAVSLRLAREQADRSDREARRLFELGVLMQIVNDLSVPPSNPPAPEAVTAGSRVAQLVQVLPDEVLTVLRVVLEPSQYEQRPQVKASALQRIVDFGAEQPVTNWQAPVVRKELADNIAARAVSSV